MNFQKALLIPMLAACIGCSDSNSTAPSNTNNNNTVLNTHIDGSITDSNGAPISGIEVRFIYKLNHYLAGENIDAMSVKLNVPSTQQIVITIHPPQSAKDSVVFNGVLNAGNYTNKFNRFLQMGIYKVTVDGTTVHDTSYYLCEWCDLSSFVGATPNAISDASGKFKIDLPSADFGRLIVNGYGSPIMDTVSTNAWLQFIPKTTYRSGTQEIVVKPGSSITATMKLGK